MDGASVRFSVFGSPILLLSQSTCSGQLAPVGRCAYFAGLAGRKRVRNFEISVFNLVLYIYLFFCFCRSEKNRTTGFLVIGCTLSLAMNAIYYGNYGQLLGTVLMLAAFSLFRSNRARLGLPPVDWFHYALVISNILFITALGVHVYPQSFSLKGTPFHSLMENVGQSMWIVYRLIMFQ